MSTRALVLAKAPVAGQVKTRLGADVGMAYAADLAAAALLDTLLVCTAAFGPGSCRLALAGDLTGAVRAEEIRTALGVWTVVPQRGGDFAERLVNAHLDAAGHGGGVVQIGMDTPQVTADGLTAVADGLADHEAVLGHAHDGGWWVLGLRRPADAAALRGRADAAIVGAAFMRAVHEDPARGFAERCGALATGLVAALR
jgi:glycosyltransferase A (GT-A) superfamily protein (DUF2064 family)